MHVCYKGICIPPCPPPTCLSFQSRHPMPPMAFLWSPCCTLPYSWSPCWSQSCARGVYTRPSSPGCWGAWSSGRTRNLEVRMVYFGSGGRGRRCVGTTCVKIIVSVHVLLHTFLVETCVHLEWVPKVSCMYVYMCECVHVCVCVYTYVCLHV